MAIEFVGGQYTYSANPTIPTHQVGDLIFVLSHRNNGTGTTVPTGWTQLFYFSGGNNSTSLRYKFAASASETYTGLSSTNQWVTVYRNVSEVGVSAANRDATLNSNPATVPGLSLTTDSQVVNMLFMSSGNRVALYTAPPGMTYRFGATRTSTPAGTAGIHDTNSLVSTFSGGYSVPASNILWTFYSIALIPEVAAGFDHLDVSNSGLINAASGSGNYLELSNSGYIRKAGTEGTNSLILDASGRIVTKGS